jgi:hypothetical protein
VESEWLKALTEKKTVIPILYKTCSIPHRLASIQYIDFTSGRTNDNIAFNRVQKALGIAESSLQKPAEIAALKKKMPFSAANVTDKNGIKGVSDVSDVQTLATGLSSLHQVSQKFIFKTANIPISKKQLTLEIQVILYF